MRVPHVAICGAGHFLPSGIVTNEDIKDLVGKSPEWIVAKTGITRRHKVSEGERASGLALCAARRALSDARITAEQVGLTIVSTFSADYVFPAAAVRLQLDLGIVGGHAFDIQANCSGFVTAITIAAERLMLDSSLNFALVVGLEVCSRYINHEDPESAIYLSDGAGAVVIGRSEAVGYMASSFWTDPSNYESVRLRGGGSTNREPLAFTRTRFMEMSGVATWRQAITSLPRVMREATSRAGLSLEQVNKFIFHQANLRLIEYLMKKTRRPLACTFTNVDRVGNTGAASIAIAISEAKEQHFFANGDFVCIAGVGAGFTFGASIWRWVTLDGDHERQTFR